MTRALVPLSMTTIGLLPDRCRGCVAWELDADAVRSAVRLGDTEFEKEVWLSGVMLTWGSAGQIVTVDDQPVGFALFAPPTAVPGAAAFPTSPVSPDAVLLTTARILPEFTGQGLARYLMNGVVRALTRRGVRAIELFGREDAPAAAEVARSPAAVRPAESAGRAATAGERAVEVRWASWSRAGCEAWVAAGHRSPLIRVLPSPTRPRPTGCRVPAAGRLRPGGRLRGRRPAPPLPAAAVRAGPGHRLEGRGGVGAGEAVHGDQRAGVTVTAGAGAGRPALTPLEPDCSEATVASGVLQSSGRYEVPQERGRTVPCARRRLVAGVCSRATA